MSSSFGKILTLTTFGESHGLGIGGVLDGCPAGIKIDLDFIQGELDKRRPGTLLAKRAGTNRNEEDKIKILSGVYKGKTTGTSLAFFIENTNQHSSDYNEISKVYRPGHGDITYDAKYGFRDPRGGGRASARETAARVAGGAIAQLFLKTLGIEIYAYPLAIDGIYAADYGEICVRKTKNILYTRPFYAPNEEVIEHWEQRINEAKANKDTVGGLVRIEVLNAPAGLGEPVFDKLDGRLAYAIMGIGAVKAVEIGDGFLCATSRGSVNNDKMRAVLVQNEVDSETVEMLETAEIAKVTASESTERKNTENKSTENKNSDSAENNLPNCSQNKEKKVQFESNHAGGTLAGISTGQDIIITATVKPIPSILQEQQTVTHEKENYDLVIGGRHDISAIPRNVPVMTAMTALTIADMVLMQRRMQQHSLCFQVHDGYTQTRSCKNNANSILNTQVFPLFTQDSPEEASENAQQATLLEKDSEQDLSVSSAQNEQSLWRTFWQKIKK